MLPKKNCSKLPVVENIPSSFEKNPSEILVVEKPWQTTIIKTKKQNTFAYKSPSEMPVVE